MIQLIIIIVFIILILYRIRNTEKYETNKEPFFTLWVPGKKGYEKVKPAHIKNGKVVPPKTIKYNYDYNTIYVEIVDYDKGLIKEIEYKSPKPYLVTTTHNEYILPVNYSSEFKDYMNKKVVVKFYRNGKNPDNFFHLTHVTLPKSKESESSNISNLESDEYKPRKSVQDCIGSWNVIKKNIKKRGNLAIRTDDWEYKHTKDAEKGGKACPYENGKRISVKYSDIASHKTPFRDPNINTKLITSPNYIFDEIDKPERVAYLLSKGAYVHPMDRPSSPPSPPPPPPPPPPPKKCYSKIDFCVSYVDKDNENNGIELDECRKRHEKAGGYYNYHKNFSLKRNDPTQIPVENASKQNARWEDDKYKYIKIKYVTIREGGDDPKWDKCEGYNDQVRQSYWEWWVPKMKELVKTAKMGDSKTFTIKMINEKYIDKMVEDKKIDKIQAGNLKRIYSTETETINSFYYRARILDVKKLFRFMINPTYLADEFDKWETDNKSYFGKCEDGKKYDSFWKKHVKPQTNIIDPIYYKNSSSLQCPKSVMYCRPNNDDWKYTIEWWKEYIKEDISKIASGSKGCYVNPKAESLLKPKKFLKIHYPYKKHDNMENMDLNPNTNTNLINDPYYYWNKHIDIVAPKKTDKDCKAELQKPKKGWEYSAHFSKIVPSASSPSGKKHVYGKANYKSVDWTDEIEWKYVVTNPGKDGGDKDHCFYNIPNSAHGLKHGDKIKIKTSNMVLKHNMMPSGLHIRHIRQIRDPNYFHELIKNPNYWVDKFKEKNIRMDDPIYKEYF